MNELQEAISYLNKVTAITRADFHQLSEIRCLLFIKKNLPHKLSKLGMTVDIDRLLREIVIPEENFNELNKEQFEELMEAFVDALANTIHLYSSADLPINWTQLFTLDK